jgi:glycosyltransferase involved in cell wall biosynthesis
VTRVVLHVGPDVHEPGGIAGVVRAYQRAHLDAWRVEPLASSSARSRGRWLYLFAASAARIAFASRRTVAGLHFHVSQRFDVVRTLVLLDVARARRLPRIVTVHGSQFMDEVRRRPGLVRAMLRRADAVTVLSTDVEAAVRELGIDDVRLLPNPVRARAAAADVAGRRNVLFAGEVGRRKGVDVLLAAWPRVRADAPEMALHVAGPVAEPGLLASLPEGAVYDGVLEPDGVAAALGEARVAVLPSRAEAMPMFVLEAMAAGVPVVGTPVGSVEWMLGEAGVVVPPGDADALAEALGTLLRDPERLERMSRAAQRRVAERFSTDIFDRNVGELYASVFGRG